MNTTNLERSLQSWLADGPTGAPDDVVERALAEAATLPQSRQIVSWPRLRWLDAPARGLVQAAASIVFVVLVGGIGLILAQQVGRPVPTPSPSPTPLPTASLEWLRVGQIDASPNGFLAFNGGYLAYANLQRKGDLRLYPWSWFGTNGTDWEMARLDTPDDCTDGELISGPSHGATNGKQVVVVGRSAQCAVSWVSTDGVTWQRSATFATGNSGDFVEIWATDGAFEMVLDGSMGGPTTVWRSGDGLSWTQTGVASEEPVQLTAGGAAPGGARVIALNTKPYVSEDGVGWTRLESLTAAAAADRSVLSVLAPSATDPNWLVGMTEPGGDGAKSMWVSSDLATWRSSPLPLVSLAQPVRTSYGYLLIGRGPAASQDGPFPHVQLVSVDGTTWQRLPDEASLVGLAADGPAGVIGLAPVENGAEVWQLQPTRAAPSASPTQSTPASVAPLSWSDPVDIPTERLLSYSMAVDPRGVVHLAGAVAGEDGIFHLSNATGAWTSEQVTTGRDHLPIIRFDGDAPTISFVRYGQMGGEGVFAGTVPSNPEGVFVTTLDGGRWSTPRLIPMSWSGPAYGNTAHAYDMDTDGGVIHLAWAETNGLWHATDYTGEWVAEQVDSDGVVPRLRLASDGSPRLVFHREDGAYYAIPTAPEGGFPLDTARLIALGGAEPMVELDASYLEHVVFQQAESQDDRGGARYAARPFADPVSVFDSYGYADAFDADSAGGVHVLGVVDTAWVYAAGNRSGFIEFALASFTETVDGARPKGALAVDEEGRVHVLMESLVAGWHLLYRVGTP